MLLDDAKSFRAVDELIGEAINEAQAAKVVLSVKETAESVIAAAGADPKDKAEVIHRISIRSISRGLPLEFRGIRSVPLRKAMTR